VSTYLWRRQSASTVRRLAWMRLASPAARLPCIKGHMDTVHCVMSRFEGVSMLKYSNHFCTALLDMGNLAFPSYSQPPAHSSTIPGHVGVQHQAHRQFLEPPGCIRQEDLEDEPRAGHIDAGVPHMVRLWCLQAKV